MFIKFSYHVMAVWYAEDHNMNLPHPETSHLINLFLIGFGLFRSDITHIQHEANFETYCQCYLPAVLVISIFVFWV
jgi:hypothetical protein